MFTCRRRVFLKDADVTGVIYFGAFFNYALEAFELFLQDNDTGLPEFFSKGYLFPIVHAEADYTAPLRIADEVEISLRVKNMTIRSVTVETVMQNIITGAIAGKVTLVHAFVKKGELKSSEIPEEIRVVLNKVLVDRV